MNQAANNGKLENIAVIKIDQIAQDKGGKVLAGPAFFFGNMDMATMLTRKLTKKHSFLRFCVLELLTAKNLVRQGSFFSNFPPPPLRNQIDTLLREVSGGVEGHPSTPPLTSRNKVSILLLKGSGRIEGKDGKQRTEQHLAPLGKDDLISGKQDVPGKIIHFPFCKQSAGNLQPGLDAIAPGHFDYSS